MCGPSRPEKALHQFLDPVFDRSTRSFDRNQNEDVPQKTTWPWLRRQPAKLMGFARVGSNPTVVGLFWLFSMVKSDLALQKAENQPYSHPNTEVNAV